MVFTKWSISCIIGDCNVKLCGRFQFQVYFEWRICYHTGTDTHHCNVVMYVVIIFHSFADYVYGSWDVYATNDVSSRNGPTACNSYGPFLAHGNGFWDGYDGHEWCISWGAPWFRCPPFMVHISLHHVLLPFLRPPVSREWLDLTFRFLGIQHHICLSQEGLRLIQMGHWMPLEWLLQWKFQIQLHPQTQRIWCQMLTHKWCTMLMPVARWTTHLLRFVLSSCSYIFSKKSQFLS